jgi:hypothetical protein
MALSETTRALHTYAPSLSPPELDLSLSGRGDIADSPTAHNGCARIASHSVSQSMQRQHETQCVHAVHSVCSPLQCETQATQRRRHVTWRTRISHLRSDDSVPVLRPLNVLLLLRLLQIAQHFGVDIVEYSHLRTYHVSTHAPRQHARTTRSHTLTFLLNAPKLTNIRSVLYART